MAWFVGNRGESITVIARTASGQDSDGNDAFTESQTVVTQCIFWPRLSARGSATANSGEYLQGGDRVIYGLSGLVPPGTVIDETDRVIARGELYEVDGKPALWLSPLTGTQGGTEVNLTRITG
jgi:hypothetical protein